MVGICYSIDYKTLNSQILLNLELKLPWDIGKRKERSSLKHTWQLLVNSHLLSSIHPFIIFCSSKVGHRCIRSRRDIKTSLSPATLYSSSWRILRPFQMKYVIPQACSGSAAGPHTVGCAQKTYKGRRPRGNLTSCPNHLSWFFSMWGASEQPMVLKVKFKTHFSALYPWPHSFGVLMFCSKTCYISSCYLVFVNLDFLLLFDY